MLEYYNKLLYLYIMKKNNADIKLSLIDLETDNTVTGGKYKLTSLLQPERLSEKDNMYIVYWIYSKKHKDIFTEGYVGITLNYKERLRAHKKSKNKYHLNYAIKKYGWDNLQKKIIFKNLSLKNALLLENKYRSKHNIGWNSQIGGNLGVESSWYTISENKSKHSINTSIATIEGIKNSDSKEARSKRATISRKKNIDSYNNINKGSNNGKAILNEEKVKIIKCKLIPEGKTNKEISLLFDVKPYVINFIRINKNWKHVICDSPAHE